MLIWKRKGDVHNPGKYRGITLLSRVMKVLERIIDGRIRKSVEMEIGQRQQGFRKGRGMTDGMFMLRQLVEKQLEVQGEMALGLVDLEKADNTVSREMVMVTLRAGGEFVTLSSAQNPPLSLDGYDLRVIWVLFLTKWPF